MKILLILNMTLFIGVKSAHWLGPEAARSLHCFPEQGSKKPGTTKEPIMGFKYWQTLCSKEDALPSFRLRYSQGLLKGALRWPHCYLRESTLISNTCSYNAPFVCMLFFFHLQAGEIWFLHCLPVQNFLPCFLRLISSFQPPGPLQFKPFQKQQPPKEERTLSTSPPSAPVSSSPTDSSAIMTSRPLRLIWAVRVMKKEMNAGPCRKS